MKISITGSIGSGKSTVCYYLRSKGYDVFDCDKVNSKLLEKGYEGYRLIKDNFPEVFNNNELDKAKLASIVFNNESSKNKLESLLHPLILNEMKKAMENKDIFIAEVPLLFEANWDSLFDINVLVVSDEQIALDRLENRGISQSEAKERLNNQFSVQDKIKRANEIIYNNGSLATLFKAVDELLNKYVR